LKHSPPWIESTHAHHAGPGGFAAIRPIVHVHPEVFARWFFILTQLADALYIVVSHLLSRFTSPLLRLLFHAMPTQSHSTAILSLYIRSKNLFDIKGFQKLTRLKGKPWEVDDDAPNDQRCKYNREWTNGTARAVALFVSHLEEIKDDSDREEEFASGKHHNSDVEGRSAWQKFISANWRAWKVNRVVDETLKLASCSPFQVMDLLGKSKVRPHFI
jgi:hypothetical protein